MLVPTQTTLIEQTYSLILDAICDGQFEPGMRLNQDDLAERMRVSRQPIAQALSILKSQGFVREVGRRGLIVAPLEQDFFRSIYELREGIDPMAARLAAERCTEDDIAEGRKLMAAGRDAVTSGAVHDLIATDMQFHLWVYRLAGNPLLLETMRLYWNHLRRAMSMVLRPERSRHKVWDEHEAILEAIAARDGRAAENCATRHVKGTAEHIANATFS